MQTALVTAQPVDMIHTQALVDFYNGSVHNDAKSHAEGRPIYDDVEMIRIRWAGNTKSELHAPANDRCDRPLINAEDKSRFWPKWKDHPDFKPAYDAFKKGQEYAVHGTPVSELPFLTEARRAELKAINIFTAEQLVGVDPNTRLGTGLSDLRRQAKDYLERAKGVALDAKHAEERRSMQDEIASLRQMIETLANGSPAVAAQSLTVASPPAKQATPNPASPFASWEPDDIRNWMHDADPNEPKPHPRTGKAKLVELADALSRRLKEANSQPVAA